MYAIKDNVAGFYGNSFNCANNAEAMRQLTTIVNGDNGNMSMYSGDFTVYKIGEYDPKTGIILSNDPEFVFNLIDVKEKSHGQDK